MNIPVSSHVVRWLSGLATAVLVAAQVQSAQSGDWIRAGLNTNQPVWGIRQGLLWAVAPAGFRPGEPRGLIRLGYPVLAGGRYDLIYCILTATMGNMARTRLLWLKDQVISSLELYRGYRETAFAPHSEYPLSRLHRTADGGVLVAVTNDEEKPATVYPFPDSESWHYAGFRVTQYWAKPAGAFREDLRAVVNARYTYWQSARPIPGGVAFENLELRERFHDGQKFIFGIDRRTPVELGFR